MNTNNEAIFTLIMVRNNGETVVVPQMTQSQAIKYAAWGCEQAAGIDEPKRFRKILISNGQFLTEYGVWDIYRLAKEGD